MRLENKIRIYRIGFLTILYNYHAQRLIHEHALCPPADHNTYEIGTGLVNAYFGAQLQIGDLFSDKSETANRCIMLKEKYEEVLANVEEVGIMNRHQVSQAINYFATTPEFFMLRFMHVIWAAFMERAICYAAGHIPAPEFEKVLHRYRSLKMFMNFDLRTMLEQMQKMESAIDALHVPEHDQNEVQLTT